MKIDPGIRVSPSPEKSRSCISNWPLIMHSGRYLYSSAARFPGKKQCFGLEKIM